jgi:hypothetical protein
MERRAFMVSFAHAALMGVLASTMGGSRAQRPANPIARPPRPGGVFGPGRFPAASDGVNRTPPLGIFVVHSVNVRENLVQLTDADGRTARVLVDAAVFDLAELRSGDEVLVDFVVPTSANAPLRAAGIWVK